LRYETTVGTVAHRGSASVVVRCRTHPRKCKISDGSEILGSKGSGKIYFYGSDGLEIGGMSDMRTVLRLCLVTCVLALVSSTAYGQQVNPNGLPPCPKPDMSKKTDIERFAKWTNCWGRYKVELTASHKGDVLEGEWMNGNLHGQGTYYFLADNQFKGDKYVGEYKDGKWHGQGTATFARGNKYVGEFKDGTRQR